MTDFDNTSEGRDVELGAALLELAVPEHGDDFAALLDARLADRDRAERPDELAVRRRAERSGPAGRARRAHRVNRGRWAARAGVVAVAAAAVAAVVVVGVGPSGGPVHPQVATAAEIGQRISDAYTGASTLSGTMVWRQASAGGTTTTTTDFKATAAGDVYTRSVVDGSTEVSGYDVGAGRLVTVTTTPGQQAFAVIRTGVDPAFPPGVDSLGRSVAAVARTLLADPHAQASDTVYEGRDAWRLSVEAVPDLLATVSADRLEVVVDKATGFPLDVVGTDGGTFVYEHSLRDLGVDTPLPPATFAPVVPADAQVYHEATGFRSVPVAGTASGASGGTASGTASGTVAELERLAGYRPLLPATLPGGLRLSQAAYAPTGQATGVEGQNPPGSDVVSLVFRHGFDVVRVQTWRAGTIQWFDPLGVEGRKTRPIDVTLTGGALAGATAHVVVAAPTEPHLWTVSDGLVVLISGDLPAGGLTDVANSLTASGS